MTWIRCSFQGSETKRVVTETISPLKINMLRPLTWKAQDTNLSSNSWVKSPRAMLFHLDLFDSTKLSASLANDAWVWIP